uniref:Uncharacterized protein n=1 Tax=viral metagenome TaxID=1070528 RepID=A0A6C0LZY0_9ZZZZ
MGNTSSRTETIEKSDREAQIANILQTTGGYSEMASEIEVKIVDNIMGGKRGCGGEDDVFMIGGDYSDINVRLVDLKGGAFNDNSEIDVKIINASYQNGGSGAFEEADHNAIYNEIKNRIASYQNGGSGDNEFFQMLEKKLNGVDSESPFISANKFADALQKGGYHEETETATVTAKKLLNTIVQMGGEDSSDESKSDSDFSSSENSSDLSESDSDSVKDVNSDTFAILPIKTSRAKGKRMAESDSDDAPISSDDEEPFLSSSLETDDINLISYSPRN